VPRTRKITQAPDALSICNGCGMAPALPENPAGYCADCERTARAATPRATCECGCSGTPKGKKARYLPGHDSKHASALKKAATTSE
jgi:hypothetical protein